MIFYLYAFCTVSPFAHTSTEYKGQANRCNQHTVLGAWMVIKKKIAETNFVCIEANGKISTWFDWVGKCFVKISYHIQSKIMKTYVLSSIIWLQKSVSSCAITQEEIPKNILLGLKDVFQDEPSVEMENPRNIERKFVQNSKLRIIVDSHCMRWRQQAVLMRRSVWEKGAKQEGPAELLCCVWTTFSSNRMRATLRKVSGW